MIRLWPHYHDFSSANIVLNGRTYPLGKVSCIRCGKGLDQPFFRGLFCWGDTVCGYGRQLAPPDPPRTKPPALPMKARRAAWVRAHRDWGARARRR